MTKFLEKFQTQHEIHSYLLSLSLTSYLPFSGTHFVSKSEFKLLYRIYYA